MVEPDGILNDFGRETVAFVQFWLSHELNTGRLSANLSVPKSLLELGFYFSYGQERLNTVS